MRLLSPIHVARTAILLWLAAVAVAGCDGPRVPGRPARVERAYGQGQRGVVGQPLARPLVVRVLDGSGVPLAGVRVDWRAADSAGGAVRFAGRTDRFGYARAVWMPGPRAGVQVVSAEVSGLPPVSFTARAAAPRLAAPASRLAAAPPRFATLRSARSAAAAPVPVPAIDPGAPAAALRFPPASIIDSAGPPAAPSARPVLAGRLYAADDGPLLGLEARIESPAGQVLAEAAVDGRGRFALPLPRSPAGAALLVIAGAAGAPAAYLPAVVPLPPATGGGVLEEGGANEEGRADQDTAVGPDPVRGTPAGPRREIGIVLVPRRWRITAGSYAGRDVAIELEAAFRAPCGGCSAFFPAPAAGGSENGPVRAWADTMLPLRVLLDRAGPVQPLGTADSAAFWGAAALFERTLGQRLFRPVGDEPEEGAPAGGLVLVRIDPGQLEAGLSTTASQRGEIGAAVVSFRHAALLGGPEGGHLVGHELLHALGAGHTCAWRSLVADTERCPERYSKDATPEDVAYLELLERVKALERREAAGYGLRAAQRGTAREAAARRRGGAARGRLRGPSASRRG